MEVCKWSAKADQIKDGRAEPMVNKEPRMFPMEDAVDPTKQYSSKWKMGGKEGWRLESLQTYFPSPRHGPKAHKNNRQRGRQG